MRETIQFFQGVIMAAIVFIVMCIMLFSTGCSHVPRQLSAEVAVGVNVSPVMPWSQGRDGGFAGPSDTVRFSVRYDISERSFCQASHTSHLSAGWPFNGEREDWLDVVECGARFGGGAR